MRIFLVLNLNSKEKTRKSVEAIERLEKHHIISLSITEAFQVERPDLIHFDAENSDIIMSIGGDGTLLKAAHLAYPLHKPVIGVNAGHLGALCAYPYDELDPKEPLKGCHAQERYGVEFRAKNLSAFALNEVVVSSYSRSKSALLSIDLGEGEFEMKGDGFLFSSPTGSSAYNHSLGGPSLGLEEEKSIFLPLAPIKDELRKPILVDADRVISTTSLDKYGPSPVVVYDGIDAGQFKGEMKLRRSRWPLFLYKRAD